MRGSVNRLLITLGVIAQAGALLIFCSLGTAWASATSELLRTQGLLSLSEGAYEQAVGQLEQAIAADPQDNRARYFRGIAYSRLGNYQSAIRDLEAAEKAGLTYKKLWFELGFAYYRNKQFGQAQAALAQSLATVPDHAASHYYLGLSQYQNGNLAASLAPLQRAEALDSGFGASAAYLQADALLRLNRSSEAEPVLANAIPKYPESIYANPMQEMLDSIQGTDDLWDRFDVTLSTGVVSDSNVGLFPDSDTLLAGTEDDSDHRLELAMDLRAHLVKTKTKRASVGYRFFDSFHQDRDDFDILSHSIYADLSRTWGGNTLGLNYLFVTADLDDDDFSNTHVVTPNLTVQHGQSRFSLLMFEWRNNDYDLVSETGRSGNAYRARYRHYWLGTGKRYGYAEAGIVADDTDARAFDYQGYRADFGYQHSWGQTLLKSSISYERREYDDAIPDREDDRTEVGFRLINPLRHGFELEAALVNIFNRSSSEVFDYTRTVASVYVRYRR